MKHFINQFQTCTYYPSNHAGSVFCIFAAFILIYAIVSNVNIASGKTAKKEVNGQFIENLAVRSLVVLDKQDKPKIQMVVSDNGVSAITIFGNNEAQKTIIKSSKNESAFEIYDNNGINKLTIGVSNSGKSLISINRNGKPLAAITVSGNNSPGEFCLAGGDGILRHYFGERSGMALYLMRNKVGDKANMMYISDSEVNGLSIGTSSRSGSLAFIGMYDGAPVMTLKDKRNAKVFAGFGKNTGGMLSVQEHGQEIWHAGVQGQAPAAEIDVTDLLK